MPYRLPLPGPLLAIEAFAIWVFFSVLPLMTGHAGIREAWDTDAYWSIGVPLLVLSVAAAGYASNSGAWKLALWTLAGHFLAMLLVPGHGGDLGLLPLALVLIGIPAFGALTLAAYVGLWLRRWLDPQTT
jgi:hypothetical protein